MSGWLEPDEWEDRTGPLCRHWDDLGCAVLCAECGVACGDHEDRGCGEWLEHGSPESYATALDCSLREWAERANAVGFAWRGWLRRHYERSDLVHEMSIRASPMLTMLRR